MYSNHRPMVPQSQPLNARLIELLDAVKNEFDSLTQEAGVFRMHKDEYEHKISAQLQEMQAVQRAIYELEMTHQRVKQQYEEDIARLRKELEQRGGVPPPRETLAPVVNTNAQAPPALGHGPSNLFGGIMSGQGQSGLAPLDGAGYPTYTNGKPAMAQSGAALPAQAGVSPTSTCPSQNKRKGGSAVASDLRNTGRTSPPPPVGSSLGDLDLDKIPAASKKESGDWWIIYNPKLPKTLDATLVHSLEHASVVCCVRFSADGKFVATGCNKSAQIFDVQTGQKVSVFQDEASNREGDLYIRSVCFSPDGKYLAAGAEDKQIRIWDIKTRRIRHTFSGHEQDIYSLDFSRNGRHIASGSGDRTARVWDMETGQCMMTLSIEDGVTTVAISPDGRYVAAGSLDKVVRVWDAQSGYLVERLEGHKDSVYSVAFSPNGKDLVSGSLDKTIKLWELGAPRGQLPNTGPKGGVCLRTFHGHKDFVLSVALTPDGSYVVSGSKDRGVQFWNPELAQPIFMLQGHKNSVISVATSPAGGMFATGSGDCRARIWKFTPV